MSATTARVVAVLVSAAVLVVCAAFSPLALRSIDAFGVQRVEVLGARHLTARAAVAASGVTTGANVFDDPNPWLDGLHSHPLVASAQIERRLPVTLVIRITEAVPVAFARTPELRAIDETGRVLPTNPADAEMDLPVLAVETKVSAAGRAADVETRRLAAFLGTVMRQEPALIGWISELGVHGSDISLVLRNATDAEVLVSAEPGAERLHELHVTLTELATQRYVTGTDSTTLRAADTELSRVRRIDVRFHDQIVVALHGRKS